MYDYTQQMGGVDRNDQYMTYFSPLRRTIKWPTKLAIHLFSLCVTNAYILHKHYGPRGVKLDHEEFILKIVEYLLEEGMKTRVSGNPPERIVSGLVRNIPVGDHFPEQIPRKEGTKRKPSSPVLLAMDHGQISEHGDCQRDVPESGAKFAKKSYV